MHDVPWAKYNAACYTRPIAALTVAFLVTRESSALPVTEVKPRKVINALEIRVNIAPPPPEGMPVLPSPSLPSLLETGSYLQQRGMLQEIESKDEESIPIRQTESASWGLGRASTGQKGSSELGCSDVEM